MWIGKSFSVIAVLKRSEDFVFVFVFLLKRPSSVFRLSNMLRLNLRLTGLSFLQ